MEKLKYLVINGPNINLTGIREKDVYGIMTIDEINAHISEYATKNNLAVDFYISNSEGSIIDTLHSAMGKYDGIVLNAGALAHYSHALADAIVACGIPTVEVHMSNIFARESFRSTSVISRGCIGIISGFGANVYELALSALSISADKQSD